MSKEIYDVIVELLEKKGPVPGGNEMERRDYHYLDAGHLDSFSTIKFILEVEEAFNIMLAPEDTESVEFRTVNGLINIVERKLKIQ